MKLEPSAMTYEFDGGNGYRFSVDCEQDKETNGWSAVVTMATDNFPSAETAVEHLALSAREFLIQLKAKGGAK